MTGRRLNEAPSFFLIGKHLNSPQAYKIKPIYQIKDDQDGLLLGLRSVDEVSSIWPQAYRFMLVKLGVIRELVN